MKDLAFVITDYGMGSQAQFLYLKLASLCCPKSCITKHGGRAGCTSTQATKCFHRRSRQDHCRPGSQTWIVRCVVFEWGWRILRYERRLVKTTLLAVRIYLCWHVSYGLCAWSRWASRSSLNWTQGGLLAVRSVATCLEFEWPVVGSVWKLNWRWLSLFCRFALRTWSFGTILGFNGIQAVSPWRL